MNTDHAERALRFASAYGPSKVSQWRADYPDMTVILTHFTREGIPYILTVDADAYKSYLNVAVYVGVAGPGVCLGAFSCISDDDLLHRTIDHLLYEHGQVTDNV